MKKFLVLLTSFILSISFLTLTGCTSSKEATIYPSYIVHTKTETVTETLLDESEDSSYFHFLNDLSDLCATENNPVSHTTITVDDGNNASPGRLSQLTLLIDITAAKFDFSEDFDLYGLDYNGPNSPYFEYDSYYFDEYKGFDLPSSRYFKTSIITGDDLIVGHAFLFGDNKTFFLVQLNSSTEDLTIAKFANKSMWFFDNEEARYNLNNESLGVKGKLTCERVIETTYVEEVK